MAHPYYKFDSDSGEYTLLEKPPRAKLMMLREVVFPYLDGNSKPTGNTYTVIMDASEECKDGKILREFSAWIFISAWIFK